MKHTDKPTPTELKILNLLEQLRRDLVRTETRLCKLAIHQGASDALNIQTTKEQA